MFNTLSLRMHTPGNSPHVQDKGLETHMVAYLSHGVCVFGKTHITKNEIIRNKAQRTPLN